MKRALVLGSAACLWDDVEKALLIGEYDAVIAAKQAGIEWPGQLYGWVTLHPEWMTRYRREREAKGFPPPREVVANLLRPGVDRVIEFRWPEQGSRSGSSGGVAIKYALDEGFERVVCCGIPMSPEIGRIDGRQKWAAARTYQRSMLLALPRMRGRVKSVSGWTMEKLGEPTTEWLMQSAQ